MRLFKIIKKPVVTEKASREELSSSRYVFEVDSSATKIDVKKAIKEIYGIEVADVNMMNARAKTKFGKKGLVSKRKEVKKAYVTLKDKKAKLDVSIIK